MLTESHKVYGPFERPIGGTSMIADALTPTHEVARDLATCRCGETLPPSGRCQNVGTCADADRNASRSSRIRGTAASARPQAWTLGGRVD